MTHITGTATGTWDYINQCCDAAVANSDFTEGDTITVNHLVHGTTPLRYIVLNGLYFCFFVANDASNYGTAVWFEMKNDEPQDGQNYNRDYYNGQIYTTYTALFSPSSTFTAPFEMFVNGNEISCVLEIYPNVFCHHQFGQYEKLGAWTGGEYCGGVPQHHKQDPLGYVYANSNNRDTLFSWAVTSQGQGSSYVRWGDEFGTKSDFAVVAGAPIGVGKASPVRAFSIMERWSGYSQSSAPYGLLMGRSPNDYNSRARLMTLPMYIRNTNTPVERYHYTGYMKSARTLDMELIQPKQIVDGNWKVFPVVAKTGDAQVHPVSGNLGIAYYLGQ